MGRLIGLLLLLAAALGAGLWATPHLVPEDRLARAVAAELAAATGSEVTLGGALQLALLPTPRLVIEDVRLDGGAGRMRVRQVVLEPGLAEVWGLLRLDPTDPPARPRNVRLDGVEVSLPDRSLPLPSFADLDLPYLEATRVVVRRPVGALVTFDRVTLQGGRLEARGHGGERAVRLALRLGPDGRLDLLEATAGDDQLRFAGRWQSTAAARGRLGVETADVAGLRAWLETILARPLGLPPLLDATLDGLAGRLAATADLTSDDAGWRLDELVVEQGQRTIRGHLALADGRITADLDVVGQGPDEGERARLLARWRVAPDLLAGIERLALDADGLRLSLARTGNGLDAALRVGLAGRTDLALDGTLAPLTGAFTGELTLVAEAPALAFAALTPIDLAPLGGWAVAARVVADPDRLALEELSFVAETLSYQGAATLEAGTPPRLHLDGIVDRWTLPEAWRGHAVLREGPDRLAAIGSGLVIDADLAIRRLAVTRGETIAAKLVGRLDGEGLWLTAVELEARGAALSLTGGLAFAERTFDGLGRLELEAPARLAEQWRDRALPAGLTLPSGAVRFALAGPLNAAKLDLDGTFGGLTGNLRGRFDLVGSTGGAGRVALRHADAAALLRAFGRPVPPGTVLAGEASLEGEVAWGSGPRLTGSARLAGLEGAFALAGGSPWTLDLAELTGDARTLAALLAANDLWPSNPVRWLRDRSGDWPDRGPLGELWPGPFAVTVEAPRLTRGDAPPLAAGLVLRGDAERLHLDRLDVGDGETWLRLSGTAERGRRGIDVEATLESRGPGDGLAATALGLGWLGPGRLDARGTLRGRGVTVADVVASLTGTIDVAARVVPQERLAADEGLLRLPGFGIAGPLAFDRAHARLDPLMGVRGALDLAIGYVAATVALDETRTLRIEGPLVDPGLRLYRP